VFLLLTPVVLAKDPLSQKHAHGGLPSTQTESKRIAEDYVQTQLDWRSYDLNNWSLRRDDLPQGEAIWCLPR
jgi:hypothetical protein